MSRERRDSARTRMIMTQQTKDKLQRAEILDGARIAEEINREVADEVVRLER